MAERISVNYEELEQISKLFDQQFDRTEDLVKTIRACMEQLQSGGWIGLGAESFYAEMEELVFPGLDRLCQAFQMASETTMQAAERYAEAEDQSVNNITI